VRHAVFGLRPAADLAHVGALVVFALLMGVLAITWMRKRLID
jgi:lipooligosaccharide transport system permease protein